jgi:hypothetical protein
MSKGDAWPAIALYRAHGTSEQFRSEIKSDMGIERLPSGNYETNKLIIALGAIAYNLLRAIDQRACALKKYGPEHLRKRGAKQVRRRVGGIIRDIISVAAKTVSHAGKRVTKIARGWAWSQVILAIDRQLT